VCRSAFLHVFFVITTALARMAQAIYAALVPRAYTSSNQYSKLWLIAFVLPQLRAVPRSLCNRQQERGAADNRRRTACIGEGDLGRQNASDAERVRHGLFGCPYALHARAIRLYIRWKAEARSSARLMGHLAASGTLGVAATGPRSAGAGWRHVETTVCCGLFRATTT